jgi:hypothetical protein
MYKEPGGEFFHLSANLSPYHDALNLADLLRAEFTAFVSAYPIVGLMIAKSALHNRHAGAHSLKRPP